MASLLKADGRSPLDRGRSLGDSVNIATRPLHTKLNKLVITRLPLTVPPRTSTPSAYTSGLLHIAPIYIAFESLWENLLQSASGTNGWATDTLTSNDDVGDSTRSLLHSQRSQPSLFGGEPPGNASRPNISERLVKVLDDVRLPGLLRSARLRRDIQALTGWPDHVLEEQLRDASGTGVLQDFISHIKHAVEKSPHVLLAFAWVYYMALFSGGRFIRASLEAAGDDFWREMPTPIRPWMTNCHQRDPAVLANPSEGFSAGEVDPALAAESEGGSKVTAHAFHRLPLNFFHFATARDGEDLKHEFKKRISGAEHHLTSDEWDDICQEAVCIFDNMIQLVDQLDSACGTSPERDSLGSWADMLTIPLHGSRLRDSIAVTRMRSEDGTGPRNRLSRATTEMKKSRGKDHDASDKVSRWHSESNTSGTGTATATVAFKEPEALHTLSEEASDAGSATSGSTSPQSDPAHSSKSVRFDDAAAAAAGPDEEYANDDLPVSPPDLSRTQSLNDLANLPILIIKQTSPLVQIAVISNLALALGLVVVGLGYLYAHWT